MTDVQEFLRGVAWPAGAGVSYPRADPADVGRLPSDTWATASLPVGVRLELTGDASSVDISYTTATDEFGYRGQAAGVSFSVWRGGIQIDEQPAVFSAGRVTVRLGMRTGSASTSTGAGTSSRTRTSTADQRVIIYLPEGMKPTITALEAADGTIGPAPAQPRWLAYGDSIAEGWTASGPAGAWPAIAGRQYALDVVNLGYAGSARGELVSAEQIASLDADVISITHGTNCWSRIPHSVEQMAANTDAFLRVVRAGHPGIPVVVASPVVRPDGEHTPNRLGATHADIRGAMERATQSLIDGGDQLLTLISGARVLDPTLLADGVHPGDAGHAVLAGVFGGAVAEALQRERVSPPA